MQLLLALANIFHVTVFDVLFFWLSFIGVFALYYFIPLRRIYEVGFGAIIGLWVYIVLAVLLLANAPLWTAGGLLPFGFSVFIISILVYLVWILAILFPLHWGLVLTETLNPVLYTLEYLIVSFLLIFGLSAVFVYMVEQTYIFQVKTVFIWLRDWWYYQDVIRHSKIFYFLMTNQNIIIPLGVLLMVYKLFLSNLVSAVVLSIVYNLSRVGFYRKKEDSSYRVEFHEIGWGGHAHVDKVEVHEHADSGHDDHGWHH